MCVAESTSCSLEIWVWFLGMANMCVLFAGGKFSYSGPGGRALGQGRHCPNKVTCVTLSPELAVTPIESSMLSSNSWAVYTTVSILHKPWNGLQPLEQSIPALGAEYLILAGLSDYLHVYGLCADPFRGFVNAK